MKFKIHVPTKEYAFIEVELEGTVDEAIAIHDEVSNKAIDRSDLSASDWKKARMTMLLKGEFDPNNSDSLSKSQQYFINQAKLAFRDIKDENNDDNE